MDSAESVPEVHLNVNPVTEDQLTLNLLLYDTDIVYGIIIGELAERSVQKYENTVKLVRYNKHSCYMSKNYADFQSFRCPDCEIFIR